VDNERSNVPVMLGASSLLVIFAVLCLSVFAMLSISTVQADRRLGQQSREAVEAYYQADCQAEEILSGLRAGRVAEGVERQGDIYSYSCDISDTQTLAVQVRVVGQEYTILRWQELSIADWQADEQLHVWSGNGE
jgi:hypothetical protein